MERITIGQIQVRTALTESEKDEVEIVSVSQDKEGGSIQCSISGIQYGG